MSGAGYAWLRLSEASEILLALRLDVNTRCWIPDQNVTRVRAALYTLGAVSVTQQDDLESVEYKAYFANFYPEKWIFYYEFFEVAARQGSEINAYFSKDHEDISVQHSHHAGAQPELFLDYQDSGIRSEKRKAEIAALELTLKSMSDGVTRLPPHHSVIL
jgi:hypothetical protein